MDSQAIGVGPWIYQDDIKDVLARDGFAMCVSVGYVVYEDDDFITLAQSYGAVDFGQPIAIPKFAITERLCLSKRESGQ